MVLANLYAAALRYFGSAAQVEVVADPLAALDSGNSMWCQDSPGGYCRPSRRALLRVRRRTGHKTLL